MTNKLRKGGLNLQTASLDTLQRHLTDAERRLSSADSSLAECRKQIRTTPTSLPTLRTTLSEIDLKLSNLREIRQTKKGFWGCLFGLTEQPTHVKSEVLSLEKQRRMLYNRKQEIERLEGKIRSMEESVERARSWVSKLDDAIKRKQRKKESLVELRAAAAANSNETRKVGSSVKRKLKLQPWCPYCGEPLGPDPHADHIYPVSKGGRSVPRNMVFVCSECNAIKRNLTLHGFIRKYGLDRAAIEDRLEELGKEF